jgi:uncharacterized integral membrane protein
MWLKIKVWTKIVLFALLALYALVFLVKNSGREVQFWYWYNRDPQLPVLTLVLATFVVGVIGTILIRTTFKTIRQVRELQTRGRSERLQREVDEMKMKAATLRTREEPAATDTDPPPSEPTV